MHVQQQNLELANLTSPVGEEPVLRLTKKAVEMVKEAMVAENLVGHGLRVFIQGGGCGGFQYGLDFDQVPKPGDFELEFEGLKVWVDQMSAMHLEGTVVDYETRMSGSGFKFNNPNAKTTCGCGSSFSA